MRNNIQSIKFFVNVPSVKRGGHNAGLATEVKSTYLAIGEPVGSATIEHLEVVTTPGPQATLEIHQRTSDGINRTYIYQLSDILGRIEITS